MAAMSEMIVDKTPDGGFRNDHMARMNDASTIILDLEGQELGDDNVIEIAEALKTNTTLRTLKLTDNGISDVGAVAIANALKENSTLTHLSLQDNDVTNEGAIAIGEALDTNTGLKIINLGYNDVGVEGISALLSRCRHDAASQNNSLISLDLQFNDIGPDCADAIVQAIQAPATPLKAADGSDKQYGLTSLTLLHTELGAETAVKIADALTVNGGNRRLKHLDLGSNDIGDEGTIALASALGLTDSSVAAGGGDRGIPSALSHIFLFDNGIGPAGCEALIECLKVNKILTFIDLEENDEVEDEPELLESLNNALSLNRSLKIAHFAEWCTLPSSLGANEQVSFDFEGDNIGDDGTKEIARILSQGFSNEGGGASTDSNLANLTALNLNDNSITEEGVSALADMLELLTLKNNEGGCRLKEISLKFNPIFKQGTTSSTAMSRIEAVLQSTSN